LAGGVDASGGQKLLFTMFDHVGSDAPMPSAFHETRPDDADVLRAVQTVASDDLSSSGTVRDDQTGGTGTSGRLDDVQGGDVFQAHLVPATREARTTLMANERRLGLDALAVTMRKAGHPLKRSRIAAAKDS
jgi:hypothetical protein